MTTPHLDLPIDETSRARLATDGLTLRIVDTSSPDDFRTWSDAVDRGFLGSSSPAEQTEQRRARVQDDRLVGVYDTTAAQPEQPVATTHCWPADLSLPGGRTRTAWAISGVTVSQTHRRRGIARAMIEAELRTAVALGLPVAMLTVSESTIYPRFGFSPAAFARDLTISTRRVRWTGAETSGRVHHVTPEQLRHVGHAIADRTFRATPGDVATPDASHLWLRRIGLGVGDDESAKKLRLVRFDDQHGAPQGFAAFHLEEDAADVTDHTLVVDTMVAATPEAYAALWRFVLETDLVSTVKAHLRPVDEPLRWMIDDFRAVHVDERDHLWLRILDVPAALTARSYSVADHIVLRVDDPLGHADGTFGVTTDESGGCTVAPNGDVPDATMTVNALGSLLLGGVPARTLVATGAVTGDAERLDRLFHSPVEPFLSTWF
ncbi:GNAT family N-acetyltransferase [Aeromicrobium fastidiosum]|uniref:GNAT family N-acetyltransferase n=1 Tax=Aeromicrobium fastidiosum TaxID=52699 RepID=A0A641AHQ3_9ACTN|nr:GNAT family N-acetyltransferase [Aeromicrobium fastidiosum]KAA1373630.1 GNAT family N-acetyltransferase [Aeromicrobium fastidiosum]MBP2391183.1 putative acetyltransferase [Aeromicrobium fastidiosum]